MVAVAGVGGIATLGTAMASRQPQGLEACTSATARAGLRNAILTRIAANGGETDAGYALSLDTPQLESVDYGANRTICGGTARWSVPEHRRAALDGISELSEPVRYMIEPGHSGGGMVVALVGGGDRIADWLGAPPPPPAPPPPEMLRADYVRPEARTDADPVVDALPPPDEVAPGLGTVIERLIAGMLRPSQPAAPDEPPAGQTSRAAGAETRATTAPARPAADRARPAEVARAMPAERAAPAPSTATRRLNTEVVSPRQVTTPPARAQSVPAQRPAPGSDANPTPVSARRTGLAQPPMSGGPSFDCRLSRNAAERAICGDDRLAQMDVAMSRRYAAAQAGLDARGADALRAEQRDWLRRRDACQTLRCLEGMYETRAARLSRTN